MTLAIDCSCGAHLEIDAKFSGQMIQCPDCQQPLQAPTASESTRRTSGLALAAFILVLVGAFTVVGTVLAVILGMLGLRAIARNPQRLTGNGYALTSIVLGVVFTAISLFAYLRVELFGLDRILREVQWAGKLSYDEPLELGEKNGFVMVRPSRTWGVLHERDTNDNFERRNNSSVILVNVRDDAQAIGFFFGTLPDMVDKLENHREAAVQNFAAKMASLFARKHSSGSPPEPKVISTTKLPPRPGREIPPQEVELQIHLGKHDRTFLMHIIPGQDGIFVVAAGARSNRFAGIEPQLRKIVTDFKVTERGGF